MTLRSRRPLQFLILRKPRRGCLEGCIGVCSAWRMVRDAPLRALLTMRSSGCERSSHTMTTPHSPQRRKGHTVSSRTMRPCVRTTPQPAYPGLRAGGQSALARPAHNGPRSRLEGRDTWGMRRAGQAHAPKPHVLKSREAPSRSLILRRCEAPSRKMTPFGTARAPYFETRPSGAPQHEALGSDRTPGQPV